ncbi:2506_t:CDS:2 [Diversispora eburnea]|uniref:2506_t:CDS:1 n=1 Tax=Diversispora eburnea TaxID=1213867 RepID=A0A9N8ZEM7_9GLOM|nr:2506_t:CDS:2 [Diversispora eburnea]
MLINGYSATTIAKEHTQFSSSSFFLNNNNYFQKSKFISSSLNINNVNNPNNNFGITIKRYATTTQSPVIAKTKFSENFYQLVIDGFKVKDYYFLKQPISTEEEDKFMRFYKENYLDKVNYKLLEDIFTQRARRLSELEAKIPIDLTLLQNDFAGWLESIGCGIYASHFEGKSWKEIIYMDWRELEALGMRSRGLRTRLVRFCYRAREELEKTLKKLDDTISPDSADQYGSDQYDYQCNSKDQHGLKRHSSEDQYSLKRYSSEDQYSPDRQSSGSDRYSSGSDRDSSDLDRCSSDRYISDRYSSDRCSPGQYSSNRYNSNRHSSNQYSQSRYNSSSDQYSSGRYSADRRDPGHNSSDQYRNSPNRYSSGQYRNSSDRYSSGQYRNSSDRYSSGQYRNSLDRYSSSQYRNSSDRYNSDRYSSDRYDSDRYSSDRYNSDRYSSDRYNSDRYSSDRYNSDRYNSDRYSPGYSLDRYRMKGTTKNL